jgi:hypothetical protein
LILDLISKGICDLCQFIGKVISEVDAVCFGKNDVGEISSGVIEVLGLSACREVGDGLYPVPLSSLRRRE